MQSVSTQFKNTAVSSDITPVRQTTIALLDNVSNGIGITTLGAVGDGVSSDAVNGITGYGKKWAFADPYAEGAGGRYFADGTLYPPDTSSELGWEGAAIADASGNVPNAPPYFYALLIIYAAPVSLQTFGFWADSFQGYPIDFTIDYDPAGTSSFTNIVTVTGNALTTYSYTLNSPITVKTIRFNVTKTSTPGTPARIVEFEGSYSVTASVGSLNILQERSPQNATVQIGNASASQLDLKQDNTGGLWYPHGSSAYASYLRGNRRIRVQAGFKYSNGTTELVPMGTFYSMAWQAPSDSVLANVKAQDRMKILRDKLYRFCPLQTNQTTDACILQALLDAGIGASETVLEASSTVIPYACAAPTQSFFDYITSLAAADGGVVYFDENDIFHFQTATYLHNNSVTSQITFTDNSALITQSDEWTDGEVRNRVVVAASNMQVGALTQVWAYQGLPISLTVAQIITFNVAFSSWCTNVQAPVMTAGAHITINSYQLYGQSALIVIENVGGGGTETLTALTIQAQPITVAGTALGIAETSAVTSGLESPRELSINNPFIESTDIASALAANLLNIYSNPPPKIHVETQGLPHLELGDRVTVNSAQSGINADYWVIRHQFTDDGGFHSALDLYAVV